MNCYICNNTNAPNIGMLYNGKKVAYCDDDWKNLQHDLAIWMDKK